MVKVKYFTKTEILGKDILNTIKNMVKEYGLRKMVIYALKNSKMGKKYMVNSKRMKIKIKVILLFLEINSDIGERWIDHGIKGGKGLYQG